MSMSLFGLHSWVCNVRFVIFRGGSNKMMVFGLVIIEAIFININKLAR